MAKKKNMKSHIASVAWRLFHEKGYENTTIEEIISQSGISKGTFYHYFSGKDGLLSSLSDVFDSWYEETLQELDEEMNSYDKLICLSVRIHTRIGEEIPVELLASLYSSQAVTRGDKHLTNQNRYYYRIVNLLVDEGQRRGQITRDLPFYEIARLYTLCERAIIYDYCISGGSYSLGEYTRKFMPMLFSCVKA